MRAVIQRVSGAAVSVDGAVSGKIGPGLLILLGVMRGDTAAEALLLASKTALFRLFRDDGDKMNLSLLDTGGAALVVSQFTLCADIRKGTRPSFDPAADPDTARGLYEAYMSELRRLGVPEVASGVFGAHMDVALTNDGPATFVLDTDIWKKN